MAEAGEETAAQRQARIRREKREAKIKAGGSERLDKITKLSGRTPESSKSELLLFSTQRMHSLVCILTILNSEKRLSLSLLFACPPSFSTCSSGYSVDAAAAAHVELR